jgi:hypothetical protein
VAGGGVGGDCDGDGGDAVERVGQPRRRLGQLVREACEVRYSRLDGALRLEAVRAFVMLGLLLASQARSSGNRRGKGSDRVLANVRARPIAREPTGG